MPFLEKFSKVSRKIKASLRKKTPQNIPKLWAKDWGINTQDCIPLHKNIYPVHVLAKGMVGMFKHINYTFCIYKSYKLIRNIKFVYVLFTANSINQQDYGQIGKDDSTAVIKNY